MKLYQHRSYVIALENAQQVEGMFANEIYPNSQEKFSWAAQDCISLDGVPYIGQYSKWRRLYYCPN